MNNARPAISALITTIRYSQHCIDAGVCVPENVSYQKELREQVRVAFIRRHNPTATDRHPSRGTLADSQDAREFYTNA